MARTRASKDSNVHKNRNHKKMPKPKSNITAKEREALTSLAKDSSITILSADKGQAVIVMNTTDYKTKTWALFSDANTYHVLERDPTSKFTEKLGNQLQHLMESGAICNLEYKHIYLTSCLIPRFYGLPKIHKPWAGLHPNVASHESITYQTARLVANILSLLVSKNGFALLNSTDEGI